MKHARLSDIQPSPLVQMLDGLKAKPSAEVIYTRHETDDQGFPLCRCDACREKSKTRNAIEFARMFGGLVERRPIECTDSRDPYNVFEPHHRSRSGE